MSEKERSALIAKLMAAASVLGLSLGMATGAADAEQLKGEHTTATDVHKLNTNDHKLTTNDHKLTTDDHKLTTGDHKLTTGFLKHNTGTNQQKVNTPSSELNPQPEPPKPVGTGGPKPN